MSMGLVSSRLSHDESLSSVALRHRRNAYPHKLGSGLLSCCLVVMSLLITGCAERNGERASSMQLPISLPQSRVVDYHVADCDALWYWNEKETVENPLYWLRAMDCANRMNVTQVKTLSKEVSTAQGWVNTLRWTILLDSTAPAENERRQLVNDINKEWQQFPGSLRPLLLLWRNQQTLQVALLDERAHYQHLQESSDSEQEELRQSQGRLKTRLEETTRKLENLTDIERQLSSRKQLQSELPENNSDKTVISTTSPTAVDTIKRSLGKGDSAKKEASLHPAGNMGVDNSHPVKIDAKAGKVATVAPGKTLQSEASHAVTTAPAESKPPEAKLPEVKSPDVQPSGNKPSEVTPSNTESVKAKPSPVVPSNTKPSADKPVEPVPDNTAQPSSPAINKEPTTNDTTQTGQSTAG